MMEELFESESVETLIAEGYMQWSDLDDLEPVEDDSEPLVSVWDLVWSKVA